MGWELHRDVELEPSRINVIGVLLTFEEGRGKC
jgi:hypothetical protein